MNRKDFVEIYIEAKEVIDMLDKKDRNIYNFLAMFAQIHTDKFFVKLSYDVKDYNDKELDESIAKIVNEAENVFYVNKLDPIYRECLDIYGNDISINKFTVRYFEKRNLFIDKIIDNIIKATEEPEIDTINTVENDDNNNEL